MNSHISHQWLGSSLMSRRTSVIAAGCLAVLAVGRDTTGAEATPSAATTPPASADDEFVGISIGSFLVRDFHPAEGVRSSLSFDLYAQVRLADQAHFEALLTDRRHKLRNQVITATRVATLPEFDDPELRTVRRRILLRTRRTLPELPLVDVVLTEFKFTLEE